MQSWQLVNCHRSVWKLVAAVDLRQANECSHSQHSAFVQFLRTIVGFGQPPRRHAAKLPAVVSLCHGDNDCWLLACATVVEVETLDLAGPAAVKLTDWLWTHWLNSSHYPDRLQTVLPEVEPDSNLLSPIQHAIRLSKANLAPDNVALQGNRKKKLLL